MTLPARRGSPRVHAPRRARGGATDATSEPDPGPAPEAVFDRITGPYLRRSSAALPGRRACDEDA
jgi:hypothetical protein